MALNILALLRNGSDSMFESHYLKPFIVSMGITIILISGMGLSLRGMAGTGAAMMRRKLALICLMMVKATQE